ncbi:hypothetical protein BDZ89DRAFT_1034666 [Hymenopellis radicata]|nr:hypothetical protein BDZ89DRAFT_1034666 [Hymenopellis radicata]
MKMARREHGRKAGRRAQMVGESLVVNIRNMTAKNSPSEDSNLPRLPFNGGDFLMTGMRMGVKRLWTKFRERLPLPPAGWSHCICASVAPWCWAPSPLVIVPTHAVALDLIRIQTMVKTLADEWNRRRVPVWTPPAHGPWSVRAHYVAHAGWRWRRSTEQRTPTQHEKQSMGGQASETVSAAQNSGCNNTSYGPQISPWRLSRQEGRIKDSPSEDSNLPRLPFSGGDLIVDGRRVDGYGPDENRIRYPPPLHLLASPPLFDSLPPPLQTWVRIFGGAVHVRY